MATLVIVESPAKAKTIEKYLGKEYRVRASVGHVRDLPKSNKKALDIEGGFIPHYEISKGKEKIIDELRAEAKKASAVLLATDPDREGEAIAWHVAEMIKDANKNLKRIVFHEITEAAIKEAIQHPRDIDMALKEAQEARRVLDRLVGYDLSGLIWKKVRYGLSAGRVQSPALRIIMEREREIRAFIPEAYWVVTADTKTKKKDALTLTCVEEPKTEAEANRIVNAGQNATWVVSDVKESEQKRSARAPFTTSTLQQSASTRLGFSPSRTMSAAQKLYEAGHITYMRTDSTTMSAAAQSEILKLVTKEFGKEYAEAHVYKTKSKSAQEAHEAIRPTHFGKKSAGLTDDQEQLYKLIWERAVSSQMTDARLKRTKILANILGTETIPDFAANGSRVVFDGWLRVDRGARGEDTEVPEVTAGETLTLSSISAEGKETQPPSRYTEAGLIKELEKRGIGRPSTYASIMRTITERGYVEKDGRTLRPTDTGDVVSSFLEEHFMEYISDTFTSEMETELDEIAEGKREYAKTLKELYVPFLKAVTAKENIEKITNLGDAPKEFPCPKCGSDMIIKLGRGGKFLSCNRFPECDGARMNDGTEIKADEPIGTDPETGSSVYVLTGRFGPYVQIGEKTKDNKKPRRSSIPKDINPGEVTIEKALHLLSLPRILGTHPETKKDITTNIGRFGPYVVHDGDFRSLKSPDNPYDITLERALTVLAEEKKTRAGETVAKDLGPHPKTKKPVKVLKSKSGLFLRRGFKRISLPDSTNLDTFTIDDAVALLKQKDT